MKRLDKRLGSRGPAAHSWVFVRRPALPSRWIAALPSYQRNTIVEMRARGESYEDIASTWIAAGASNTAPFSTGGPPQPDPGFLEKLRVEVRAYLCGDKKYDKDRKQLIAGGKEIHAFVISGMSFGIAPFIGAASIVIAPLIALILAAIGKVSLNAWCATSWAANDICWVNTIESRRRRDAPEFARGKRGSCRLRVKNGC